MDTMEGRFTRRSSCRKILLFIAFVSLLTANCLFTASAFTTRYYDFQIKYEEVTRVCHTKSLVSVNGKFPGPTVFAEEGDELVVKITNKVKENVTIHWHGVRQLLTCWVDGPAYVTQCPVQTGQSFTHRFTVAGQRGTLFWHAHISWLRATVYGAIVIKPPHHVPYPFNPPDAEATILLGEWWNDDVEQVIETAIQTGGIPAISNAFTINGQPGPFYNCSAADAYQLQVVKGKTYLLRIVNAALNQDLFFAIANHTLTVVAVDAEYTKPLKVSTIVVAPGQTADVLLTADQAVGSYYMAAIPFISSPAPFVPIPTAAILHYGGSSTSNSTPLFPTLPANNDTAFADAFYQSLRSLNSQAYPSNVPQTVDRDLLFTVGFNLQACPSGQTCQGPGGLRLAASVNNITFINPSISILQAYYQNIPGVYTPDFPDTPLIPYNYTGPMIPNPMATPGTKVSVIEYGSNVQLVFQDTSTLTLDSHPMHLHGYSFYVVGQGVGDFDPTSDPSEFNLVDPPLRNTIPFPRAGWVAIRWTADNPGVWFMHCHLDSHLVWGMAMAFLVKNGVGPTQTLPPPPPDFPKC